MKSKTNLQPLFIFLLLLIGGTLSPSNGVDDSVNKTPLELIVTMFIVIAISFVGYIIWRGIENYKVFKKEHEVLVKENN